MRKLCKNDSADVKMIGGVVAILITIIIAVMVFYTLSGSLDYDNIDHKLSENVYDWDSGDDTRSSDWDNYNKSSIASNSTSDILDQAGTFFTIAPIIAIVVVAVVILRYVGQI